MFDYAYLRGFIKENFGSNKKYADFLGLSLTSLYDRLANKVPFTQREINATMKLNPHENVNLLFFKEKIRKVEQKTSN